MLPFGNFMVVETLTGAQLTAAFENGLKPPCGDVAGGTGRTPQFSGLKVTYHCNGTVPVVDSILRGTSTTPLTPTDTIRIVTNDFMFTGGDGYTAFAGGTAVEQHPEDPLLNVLIEYIRAHSPIAPTVEGRRVGRCSTASAAVGLTVGRRGSEYASSHQGRFACMRLAHCTGRPRATARSGT